jgi:hypothetical protein
MQQNGKRWRSKGGAGTAVAQARYQLYKAANEQLKSAYELGFYIECVSICETIIADRLEARIQFLARESDDPTHLRTAAQAARRLLDIEPAENADLRELYASVVAWSADRNAVVHQFVKVADGDGQVSAEERAAHAKRTAASGRKIMRASSRLIKKHNRY